MDFLTASFHNSALNPLRDMVSKRTKMLFEGGLSANMANTFFRFPYRRACRYPSLLSWYRVKPFQKWVRQSVPARGSLHFRCHVAWCWLYVWLPEVTRPRFRPRGMDSGFSHYLHVLGRGEGIDSAGECQLPYFTFLSQRFPSHASSRAFWLLVGMIQKDK